MDDRWLPVDIILDELYILIYLNILSYKQNVVTQCSHKYYLEVFFYFSW